MVTTTKESRGAAIQIVVRPDELTRLDRYRAVIGLSRPAALRAALRFFLASVEAKADA